MTVIVAQRASDGIEVLTPAQIFSSLSATASVGNNDNNLEESNHSDGHLEESNHSDGRYSNTHHLHFRPSPRDSMIEKKSNETMHIDTDESSDNSSSTTDDQLNSGGVVGRRSRSTRIHSGNGNDDDQTNGSIETNTCRVLINRIIRVLLISILVILCVAIPGLVHMYLEQEEMESFKTTIENFSREMFDSIDSKMSFQFMVLGDLAREITGYDRKNGTTTTTTSHHQEWPFVTIPNFEVSASRALSRMETSSIVFAPYIANSTKKSKWEEYSIQHTSEWMPQTIDQSNKTNPTIDVDSMGSDPYFPIWQHLPISSLQLNLDLLSHEAFHDSLLEFASSAQPVIGKSFLGTADYISSAIPFSSNDTRIGADIVGTLIQPVFDHVDSEDRVLAGVLLSTLPWRRFLGNFKIDYVDSILVLENTCGQRFAYQVNEGRIEYVDDVNFEHGVIKNYHEYEEMFDFSSISFELADAVTLNDDFCTYSIRIFPLNELYQQYITKNPTIVAAITAGVFAILLVLFLSYDIILRKRMAQVTAEAVESRDIITNLFPSFVREMKDNERWSGIHGKQQAGVVSSNTCFRKSLPDCTGQNGFSSSTSTTPMAEKFENVTVMFADIVGFTKWSSNRDPEQIFTLLQTIFGTFDAIARKHKVLKIEAIGDCYVAVTGMPDEQPDHAVRMAKFCRECLYSVYVNTTKLQSILGSTEDLGVRFGLHSGPVIAGILGEKPRLQILGDVVQTAARMERTGRRMSIHMSKTTAAILMKSGKGHWLKRREDVVTSMGKGEIDTFWLEIELHSSHRQEASSVASTTGMSSTSSSNNGCISEIQSIASTHGNLRSENVDFLAENSFPFVGADVSQLKASEVSEKHSRLVDLHVEIISSYMKQIASLRENNFGRVNRNESQSHEIETSYSILDEVSDSISLNPYEPVEGIHLASKPSQLPKTVEQQLRDLVQMIAHCYRPNKFHNFLHATHVTITVHRLLTRIVTTDSMNFHVTGSPYAGQIDSDPLLKLAVVFSALVHDVDHSGVPNEQLVRENPELAAMCVGASVAEQNSIEIAWELLMDPCYADLQRYIFSSKSELLRFRQIVVNLVMATDMCNQQAKISRNKRWHAAFHSSDRLNGDEQERGQRVTLIMETIIQAADVAHTMQGWEVYRKWNTLSFQETLEAFEAGRGDFAPSTYWYEEELACFDDYVIPLAQRLRESGIFGMEGDEFVQYAVENRMRWEEEGHEVVKEMIELIPQERRNMIRNGNRHENARYVFSSENDPSCEAGAIKKRRSWSIPEDL